MPSARCTSEVLCRVRHLMRDVNHVPEILDGYIVPMEDAHQSEYIADCDKRLQFVSGFSGSRGLGVITATAAAMWTDGRYFLQARSQMDNNWTLMKENVEGTPTLTRWLRDNLPVGGRVGVDPYLMSAAAFDELSSKLRVYNLSLQAVFGNLVDIVWSDSRPSRPLDGLMILPVEYSGKSWPAKVEALRAQMIDANAKLIVLSALDEIAWLFNLRGSDIDYNPVFFAYAIIGEDFVSLFVNESKVNDELQAHLNTTSSAMNGSNERSMTDLTVPTVSLLPYSALLDYLTKYEQEYVTQSEHKVWLPPESTNYATAAVVSEDHRHVELSPVQMMKAIKNDTEMIGMRNAHLRDAVAHCEFLYWLEHSMAKTGHSQTELTEMSVAAKFEQLRREQADYVSLSFPTISAVGGHASQPHYSTQQETDLPLTKDSVFLCDSGAQYRDGTTDVTRTVCFDDLPQYVRQTYTLVLKGHIQLATLNFPNGVNGMRLDTMTRQPLWNIGLDFMHGTGHGVGHFLNVHEGPMGIGYRSSSYAKFGIRKGMVLTIEPGYYETDKFGHRIENVYEVVDATTEHQFNNVQFLTFSPITLVPIQTKMLIPELLTNLEIKWLNDYHAETCAKVGALLQQQGKTAVYKWLCEQCKPIG